jgi:hypothetical protein
MIQRWLVLRFGLLEDEHYEGGWVSDMGEVMWVHSYLRSRS